MTALSADKARIRAGNSSPASPNVVYMKASQVVYAGSGVVVDSSGYAYPATATASRVTMGVARTGATGASPDGTTAVEVDEDAFWFANKSGDLAVAGAPAYWEDDDTVRFTGTSSSLAGTCLRTDTTLGALVRVRP